MSAFFSVSDSAQEEVYQYRSEGCPSKNAALAIRCSYDVAGNAGRLHEISLQVVDEFAECFSGLL